MTPRSTALVVLFIALAPALQARDRPPKREGRRAQRAEAAAPVGCKEPAPRDAGLIAGLDAYAAGKWTDASAALSAWAAKPEAEADPGATRGLYALAFAWRQLGQTAASEAALSRVKPLLEAATASRPTLEAWYYLQGLHQMRGDSQAQLTAVSAALQALDAGTICKERDGDDWFRVGRLQSFAGNAEARSAAMRSASEAYAAAPASAPASPYRAMVERELGEAALTSNDLEAAEKHYALAAKLDPAIPGIHRQLGLIYLRRGNVEAAAAHWGSSWRREREGGNAFLYAIPVMNKVVALRKKGLEPLPGLSQYSVPALEENARVEAKAVMDLRAEAEVAAQSGTELSEEKRAEMEAAEYRALQYLLEYVARGQDLQEFALQNGLLPLIHSRGMPSRK